MSTLDIAAIEVEAAHNRAALSQSAREIHRRLGRDYLVDLAIDRVAGDAAFAASEVVGQVKENGGKAALFGAGLLLAFGAGRSAKLTTEPIDPATRPDGESHPKKDARTSSGWQTFVAGIGGVGAAAFGYAVSNLVPVSDKERELLGDVPIELKTLGSDFLEEHLSGAKQLLAGSFGVASFAAGALGLMAAFAGINTVERAANDEGLQ